jgi:hypothetical protein
MLTISMYLARRSMTSGVAETVIKKEEENLLKFANVEKPSSRQRLGYAKNAYRQPNMKRKNS